MREHEADMGSGLHADYTGPHEYPIYRTKCTRCRVDLEAVDPQRNGGWAWFERGTCRNSCSSPDYVVAAVQKVADSKIKPRGRSAAAQKVFGG